MARLTSDEQRLFNRLKAKSEAPEAPPLRRGIDFQVNLSDKEAVAAAQKLGLLDGFGGDEDQEVEDGSEEEETDETPRRRGYFGDS